MENPVTVCENSSKKISYFNTHTHDLMFVNGQFTTQTYCRGSLCHEVENYVGVESEIVYNTRHSIFYLFFLHHLFSSYW